ncbi:hypothetical protein [Acidaminococcus sp.]|uniref:hypothetical protein n=1 Tax=Acidaminococcus sp. TaxID=1872103 RepID=UPI003521897B
MVDDEAWRLARANKAAIAAPLTYVMLALSIGLGHLPPAVAVVDVPTEIPGHFIFTSRFTFDFRFSFLFLFWAKEKAMLSA